MYEIIINGLMSILLFAGAIVLFPLLLQFYFVCGLDAFFSLFTGTKRATLKERIRQFLIYAVTIAVTLLYGLYIYYGLYYIWR